MAASAALVNCNFVFNPPPVGKPDPSLPFPGEGVLDTRRRVVRKASHGTCWKTVYDMIRHRYKGPVPVDQLEGRIIEMRASKCRKKITQMFRNLPRICGYINSPGGEGLRAFLSSVFLEQVRTHLGTSGEVEFLTRIKNLSTGEIVFEENFLKEMRSFSKQTTIQNLGEYLSTLSARKKYEINKDFLEEFEITPERAYDEDFWGEAWEDLNIEKKSNFLDKFVLTYTADLFKFTISRWTPFNKIDVLISEIRRNGPLAVGGHIGSSYYPPGSMQAMARKINERTIYYFRKGTMQEVEGLAGHQVLIVGAERKGSKGYVFFIDPNYPSDPADPSSEKIFCISYRNLRKHVFDTRGGTGTFDFEVRSPFGYGYHGPVRPPLELE